MGSISHQGSVSSISKDFIEVVLDHNIRCEACGAQSSCKVSKSGENLIKLPNNKSDLVLGDRISISITTQKALTAVFWAYILPLILVLLTMIVSNFFLNELYAGMLSFLVLCPYYLSLYIFRKYFSKSMNINLEKI